MDVMRIPAGVHSIAFDLLTPANFGGEQPTAACDRPVALDPWTGLPYIPNTALKGVIAGRFGNVRDGAGRWVASRIQRFGKPDDIDGESFEQGTPSPVVFGDGLLVSFPVLGRTGRMVHVFPVSTLARLSRFDDSLVGSYREFAKIDAMRREHRLVVTGSASPDEIALPLTSVSAEVDLTPLTALVGSNVSPFLLAGSAAARRLWDLGSEDRTLTRLEGESKQVESGSLRRCQLIPPGSVFVSLVTNIQKEIDLGGLRHLQVGAWESTGAGFLRTRFVSSAREANRVPLQRGPAPNMHSNGEILADAFRRVSALQGQPISSKMRTVVHELGPRLQSQGLAKTLSFCLAKAKLFQTDRKPEADAYKRLLQWLLPHGEDLQAEAILTAAVQWIVGRQAPDPQLETRWLWLRRYCEGLLKSDKKDSPA